MLLDVEQWLRRINESAAASWLEALLPLHRLKVPAVLRKTLHATTPIERLCSTGRDCEGTITRDRDSQMRQRWLAAELLHAEKGFRRINGHAFIEAVVATIEAIHAEAECLAA